MKKFTLFFSTFFSLLFLCLNVDAQSWYGCCDNGGMNGQINALTGWNHWVNAPYTGGEFTNALGNAANYIAVYGTGGNNLGTGMNNWVNALTVNSNDSLIVGGDFTTAGGKTVNYIAQWNGTSWSA